MKVQGIEISPEQVASMASAINDRFRAKDIEAAAVAAGVEPGEIAMRAADNFIQRQRRAGRIKIIESGPYWTCATTD